MNNEVEMISGVPVVISEPVTVKIGGKEESENPKLNLVVSEPVIVRFGTAEDAFPLEDEWDEEHESLRSYVYDDVVFSKKIDEEDKETSVDEDNINDDIIELINDRNRAKQTAEKNVLPTSIVSDEDANIEAVFGWLKDKAEFIVDHGVLWGATYKDGLWRALQNEDALAKFANSCGIICYSKKAEALRKRMLAESMIHNSSFFKSADNRYIISFSDGILDVTDDEFYDRNLTDKLRYQLNLRYDEIASIESNSFSNAIREIAGDEFVYRRLQEMMGICLSATSTDSIIYIQSENLRLASVFTKFLTSVFDEDYISFVSVKDIEKQFRTSCVVGKKLLISAKEGESIVNDVENLLRIVDGDGLIAENKGCAPYNFIANSTVICAGRRFPRLKSGCFEEISSFVARVVLQGHMPSDMSLRKLLTYRADFVKWAIEGLRRFLIQEEYTSAPGCEIISDYDSFKSFNDRCIVRDNESNLTSSEISDKYMSFCEDEGYEKGAISDLISYMRDRYSTKSSSVRRKDENGSSHVVSGYKGIGFVDDDI